MSNNEPKDVLPEDARRINAECNGAPNLFTYPEPSPISEELRKYYAEIAAKLPKTKRRGRRRR